MREDVVPTPVQTARLEPDGCLLAASECQNTRKDSLCLWRQECRPFAVLYPCTNYKTESDAPHLHGLPQTYISYRHSQSIIKRPLFIRRFAFWLAACPRLNRRLLPGLTSPPAEPARRVASHLRNINPGPALAAESVSILTWNPVDDLHRSTFNCRRQHGITAKLPRGKG